MIFRIIILISSIIFFGCNQTYKKSESDIYKLKSTELVNQIFIDENIDCSCLLEPFHISYLDIKKIDTPARDNKADLIKILEISNDSLFDNQNDLTGKFRVDELKLNFKKKIIKRTEFDSIIFINGRELGVKLLMSKCPSGWFYISPPLFNDTFDIAIIDVSSWRSIGGSQRIYKFIKSKWVFIDTISIWIS